MLSGIGPAEHLAKFGISVVRDVPGVSENLMDHVSFSNFIFTVNGPYGMQYENIFNPNNSYLTDYLNKRSGPLAVPAGCEAVAFVDTEHPEKRSGLPNVEIMFIGTALKGDPVPSIIYNLNTRWHRWWTRKTYYG